MRCTSVLCLLWLAVLWGPALSAETFSSTPSANEQRTKQFEGLKVVPSLPTAPKPRVELSVRGSQPFRPGQPLQFAARLETASTTVAYQFDFGDGSVSAWTKENTAQHAYGKAGRYEASVQVGTGPYGHLAKRPSPEILGTGKTVVQVVAPPEPRTGGSVKPIEPSKSRPQPPEINYRCVLHVVPTRTEVGSEVHLTAEVVPPIEGEEYFFVFDDGESSGWIRSATVGHTYSSPRSYQPKVNVRRRGAVIATAEGRVEVASVPTKYRVFLEVNRHTAEAGQPITFKIKVEPGAEGAQYGFLFDDGEKFGWIGQNTISRSFEKEGTYHITPSVLVGERTIPGNPVTVRIMPITYSVSLTVDRNRLKPGDEGTFRARLTPGNARAEYQFTFGDDTSSPWTEADEATHSYPSPRSYPVTVQARIAGKVVSMSPPMEIQVVAPPPPPPEKKSSVPPEPPPGEKGSSPVLPPHRPEEGTSPLLIVVVVAAAVALGVGFYAALKHWRQPKVHLGYVSHIDTGAQSVGVPMSGIRGTEIGLRPFLDLGKQQVDLQGSLILKEERVL